MKVYFNASQRGKKVFDYYYQKIFKHLEEFAFKHLEDGIISDRTVQSFYQELEKKGKQGLIELYQNNVNNIKKADVVVFECSFPSLSIGFMIRKALEINKPVFALYLKGHEPHFLEGLAEEKFILIEYTKTNLKSKLAEAFEDIKPLIDTRFNFFISPKLLTYLQKASKEEGISKSAFLRKLILQHMRENQKPSPSAE